MDNSSISALRIGLETANSWAGIAALTVAIGVFIELVTLFIFSREISRTEKGLLVLATTLIIVGVLGEWWYGGEAATASENLQSNATTTAANAIRDAAQAKEHAANLEKEAADIRQRAAKTAAQAATLMKENVELERVIAPRTIDQLDIVRAVGALPRVPLFIIPLNREEPNEIAGYLVASFRGIKLGDAPAWSVTRLPPEEWNPEGITLQYVQDILGARDVKSENAAVAICKALKSEGIMATTTGTYGPMLRVDWPPTIPRDAVLIRVGEKPNHFWENKQRRRNGASEIPDTSFCTTDEFFEGAHQQLNKR